MKTSRAQITILYLIGTIASIETIKLKKQTAKRQGSLRLYCNIQTIPHRAEDESVSTIMGDDDFISSMTFASGEISCNCDVRHHSFSPHNNLCSIKLRVVF